ncbi:MAG: ABC transporter permease, partial [Pacificimonas sp.]
MTGAKIDESDDPSGHRIALDGRLTVRFIETVSPRLREVENLAEPVTLDLSNVERIDTTGAWVIFRLRERREELGFDTHIEGMDERTERLMAQVGAANQSTRIRPETGDNRFVWLERMGAWISSGIHQLGTFLAFLGLTLTALGKVIRHPSRIRWTAVVRQMEVVGVSSLGIIGLMCFLVGIVIAQQGAVQLRQFGLESFVTNLLGRLTFRELGVLMTAIMVAGRSGSAFAAQIGSMKLAEEVDAMRTIGMPPIEVLVLPRLIATVLAMPLLAFFGAMMAIAGGTLISWIDLGIPPGPFLAGLQEVVPMTDFWMGLIKAPVFG